MVSVIQLLKSHGVISKQTHSVNGTVHCVPVIFVYFWSRGNNRMEAVEWKEQMHALLSENISLSKKKA